MATESHIHDLVPVPTVFLDPRQPVNLRDDEVEFVMGCVTCGMVLSSPASELVTA